MPRHTSRRWDGRLSATAAFTYVLAASLCSESLHVPEGHHELHGGLRHQIREVRARMEEVHANRGALQTASSGGGTPQTPEVTLLHQVIGRRRTFGVNASNT